MKFKKKVIKSNYVIVPSLLNKSQKNMTLNDRWETKLFFGGQGTERCKGSEMNNLTTLFTNMRNLKFKSHLHNCVFRCRQS